MRPILWSIQRLSKSSCSISVSVLFSVKRRILLKCFFAILMWWSREVKHAPRCIDSKFMLTFHIYISKNELMHKCYLKFQLTWVFDVLGGERMILILFLPNWTILPILELFNSEKCHIIDKKKNFLSSYHQWLDYHYACSDFNHELFAFLYFISIVFVCFLRLLIRRKFHMFLL